ncbi:cell division cycle protein 16, putative [Bodo saltans]|uniref:Cell division cycle protein 16, putative n=1 Tax=Bodo saltans TaxID=75058 RepID=A0A0S4J8L2_BODSA|nr:cell division cycle protein 16, putative [Bodo saltans]|eukprot:CUG85689.1 cell division cycle protein 16, putative [Bodo saltans]
MTACCTNAASSAYLLRSAERLLYNDKRPADAVHMTQLLWQRDPSSSKATMLHVNCLEELRQYDAALHVLEQASSPAFLAEFQLHAHMTSMRCLFELGDHKRCVISAEAVLTATHDALSDSIANVSSSSETFMNHGGGGDQLGGSGGNTVGPLPMAVQALCYLGKCAELVADPERAVGYYRQALTLDPLCASAMSTLLDHRLLNPRETIRLIESLPLPPEAEPLRCYYADCAAVTIDPSVVASSSLAAAAGGLEAASIGGGGGASPFVDNDLSPQPLPTPSSEQQSTTTASTVARLAHLAAIEHKHNRLHDALRLSEEACRVSPLDKNALCVHLRVLVDSKSSPALFELGHSLANHRGRAALAVYAIGCYYFAQASYERAGRYFGRATELDPVFAEAWVAFGHCYAKLEEGEQALTVYRRALFLFPGLYTCATFVGMQYSRIHSWKVAMCFLEDAQRMCPTDPLVLNEIAVLCVRNQQLSHALGFLEKALEQIDIDTCSEFLDCILFNVATVYRRLTRYPLAIRFFTAYTRCRPRAAHAFTALAFSYHLSGDLKSAIMYYHSAMNLKPDAFCRDMLDRALALEFGSGVGGAGWAGSGGIGAGGGHVGGGAGGVHPGANPNMFPSAGAHHHQRRGGGGGGVHYVDPSPTTFGEGSSMGGTSTVDQQHHRHQHDDDHLAGPQRNRRRAGSSQVSAAGAEGQHGGGGPSPHGSVGRSLHF